MMELIIWLVLGYVFLKCVSWVLSPFKRDNDYRDNNETHIHIVNSYNTTGNNYYQGGNEDGIEETSTKKTRYTYEEDDELYREFSEAIRKGRRG